MPGEVVILFEFPHQTTIMPFFAAGPSGSNVTVPAPCVYEGDTWQDPVPVGRGEAPCSSLPEAVWENQNRCRRLDLWRAPSKHRHWV